MAGVNSITEALGIQTTNSATLKSTSKTDNMSFDFDDYLKIIVAQLQNQDMNNAADTSEFINQMVQYSTIQAMNDMNALSKSNYAMNFIGKQVVIAETNSKGELETKTGVVDGVSLYYNEPVFIVEGKEYPLSAIMIAGTTGNKSDNSDDSNSEDAAKDVDTEEELVDETNEV